MRLIIELIKKMVAVGAIICSLYICFGLFSMMGYINDDNDYSNGFTFTKLSHLRIGQTLEQITDYMGKPYWSDIDNHMTGSIRLDNPKQSGTYGKRIIELKFNHGKLVNIETHWIAGL